MNNTTHNDETPHFGKYLGLLILGLLIVLFLLPLVGCTGTTIYRTATDADGKTRAVKAMAIQGDVQGAFTLTTTADTVTLDVKPLDASQVLMQRIAVTDSKGNPLLTKDGQPIFNEIPMVSGLNHSRTTAAAHDGTSKSIRAGGSVAGTIGASALGGATLGAGSQAINLIQ